MPTPNIPVVNAGELYITGLALSNDGTTPDEIVDIAIGQCRDSTNANDIVVDAVVSADNTVAGAGGLDTGTVAANTFYAVFVIGDSTGYNDPTGLLSLSATAPVIPGGYDMFRRVGYVLTDATSDFLVFDQRGAGKDRTMYYRASIATDVTAGTAATFAAGAVNVSASIPVASTTGIFKIVWTPTAPNDTLELRCGDSAVDEGQVITSGAVAAVVESVSLTCPVGATLASGVDYKAVDGTAIAINVHGYVDQL